MELGSQVPNFSASTQVGKITLWDFISGSWAVLVTFPADYSPVCTTEAGTLSKIKGEFDARNCKLLGISVDSVERHEGWIKDINETQDADLTFPLVVDETGDILRSVRVRSLVTMRVLARSSAVFWGAWRRWSTWRSRGVVGLPAGVSLHTTLTTLPYVFVSCGCV